MRHPGPRRGSQRRTQPPFFRVGHLREPQTYTYSSQAPQVSPTDLVNDNLTPETFYTYQIVFVPDMTQKYGLKVEGGAGELRAAMDLVNGWQFTGLGPFYMKDSSTSQNVLSAGIAANLAARGVGDVIKDIAITPPRWCQHHDHARGPRKIQGK